jgi:hypothetical protein
MKLRRGSASVPVKADRDSAKRQSKVVRAAVAINLYAARGGPQAQPKKILPGRSWLQVGRRKLASAYRLRKDASALLPPLK